MINDTITFEQQDDFKRKPIAEKIVKLLNSDIDICPMAIDGGWGTGKTVFCKKLINLMSNDEDKKIIYLDAFEAETTEEPLLCILAALREIFPDDKKIELTRRIIPVAKVICKASTKAILRHIFREDIDNLTENLQKAASDSANEIIDITVNNLLDSYAKSKTNIEALKSIIETATKEKQLIIFIDELDRCRPDFALSIFELVKHIFEISGVKFIFSVNTVQLKAMIKKRYGDDVDPEIYLEKFINFTVTLPSNTKIHDFKYESNAIKMIDEYIMANNIRALYKRDSFIYTYITQILTNNNISLRCAEKITKNIKIYIELSENNIITGKSYPLFVVLTLLGIIIFSINRDLTIKILNNSITLQDMKIFVGKINKKHYSVIQELLLYLIDKDLDFSVQNFNEENKEHSIEDIEKTLNHLVGGWKFDPKDTRARDILRNAIEQLNFCR